ncbi:MAG: hypothetical protein E8D46_00225 [Nitrospira sp.]|nr:hypothetical protein [Nitrospira sp.]TKB76074.1 MAG: hypothetical protein E8D46_00225 [Nitrospira sp.]
MQFTKRTYQLIELISDRAIKARVLALFENDAALFGPPTLEVLERVSFSVLKLAMQGPEQLKVAEELYRIDTRDLLMNAEFANDVRAHEKWCKSLLDDPDASMHESSSPESVVTAFIHAMNEWEVSAWAARRQARDTSDPESYWPEVSAKVERIFTKFCTPRERPYGRQASFQRPPEYEPKTEQIVGSEIVGAKAHVDTERQAPLGGGSLRYVLHRHDDRWRIDNVKQKDRDKWIKAIL